MDCLLVSGFQDTGKNTTLVRMGNFLLNRGYVVRAGDPVPPPGTKDNFRSLLENSNLTRRVIINTASDYVLNAQELLDFFNQHANIAVLITTIRDARAERTAMWSAVQQLNPVATIEVPMAKILGQRADFNAAIGAYWQRIEQLCQFILLRPPFNL